MKIVIAGIGKLGEYLARILTKENHEITVLDQSFLAKESLINNEDVNYIEGNALDSSVLSEAGVASSDLLISVMKEDSDNLMCSLIGKKLGAKHTICRIRKPEYSDSVNIIKDTLGLSIAINPELIAASQIAQTLNIPTALDSTSFFKGRMEVISLRIKEDSILIGSKIQDISQKLKGNIIFCAIDRDGETIIPNGETTIENGDKIHITGTRPDINQFLKYTKRISNKTKEVIIGGVSNVSMYLVPMLLDMGMIVKIIDNDEEKCRIISEKIPKALVIKGDLSDQNVLYEEGIKTCDAFVSLTSIDEENIVYSMFASTLNVPKIITKMNHIDLDGVIEKASIDTVVTPHKLAGNHIVQYIRAMENGLNSSCEALYTFADSDFEISEFKVKDDFLKLNIPIKDFKFKDNILICGIQRGKNIIYPSGKDEIRQNDAILIVSKKGLVKELNDIVR